MVTQPSDTLTGPLIIAAASLGGVYLVLKSQQKPPPAAPAAPCPAGQVQNALGNCIAAPSGTTGISTGLTGTLVPTSYLPNGYSSPITGAVQYPPPTSRPAPTIQCAPGFIYNAPQNTCIQVAQPAQPAQPVAGGPPQQTCPAGVFQQPNCICPAGTELAASGLAFTCLSANLTPAAVGQLPTHLQSFLAANPQVASQFNQGQVSVQSLQTIAMQQQSNAALRTNATPTTGQASGDCGAWKSTQVGGFPAPDGTTFPYPWFWCCPPGQQYDPTARTCVGFGGAPPVGQSGPPPAQGGPCGPGLQYVGPPFNGCIAVNQLPNLFFNGPPDVIGQGPIQGVSCNPGSVWVAQLGACVPAGQLGNILYGPSTNQGPSLYAGAPQLYSGPPPAAQQQCPDGAFLNVSGFCQSNDGQWLFDPNVGSWVPITNEQGGPPQQQSSGGTYVVQGGDSLSQIAAVCCGDPNAYQEIAAVNGIADPNFIQIGDVLSLPPTCPYCG